MAHRNLHPWNLPPDEAVKVQSELRARLVLTWDGREVKTVAGVDVDLAEDKARAAIVVLRYPDLAPLKSVTADVPLVFPYIPGLLAFRADNPDLPPLTIVQSPTVSAAGAVPPSRTMSKWW